MDHCIAGPNAAVRPLEISRQEANSLLRARNVVSSLHMLELKFQVIIESYRRFEQELFEVTLDWAIDRRFNREISTRILVRVNQCVLSLLTAVRSYRDQMPQDLGKISTHKYPYRDDAKKVFTRYFDESLDYRIMEAMRNYAQHAQLPIGRFKIASAVQETEGKLSELRRTCDPRFVLDDLITNYKVRKATRDELAGAGIDWVDVKFSIRVYLRCLIEAHNEVRGIVRDEFESVSTFIREATHRYRNAFPESGNTPIYVHDLTSITEPLFVGEDVLDNLDALMSLQRNGKRFRIAYISTEVVEQHPNHPILAR